MNTAIESFLRSTVLIASCICATFLGDARTRYASGFEIPDVSTVGEDPSAEARADGPFIRPPMPSEVPSLIKSLEHSDSEVRRHAASSLSAAGPQATDALPKLLDLADAPDAETRIIVASAIARIAPKDP